MTSSERKAENRRVHIHAGKAYERGLVKKFLTAKREFRDIARDIRAESARTSKKKI